MNESQVPFVCCVRQIVAAGTRHFLVGHNFWQCRPCPVRARSTFHCSWSLCPVPERLCARAASGNPYQSSSATGIQLDPPSVLRPPLVPGPVHTQTSNTMKHNASSALLSAFQGLRISSSATPFRAVSLATSAVRRPIVPTPISVASHVRPFSATAIQAGSWLEPNLNRKKKMMKGRPRVPTGGSTKGTTVVWGDYGLRMRDHHRRISAQQLKLAEDTIKQRLRGQKYRLYKRVACNVGVYVSGNEVSS